MEALRVARPSVDTVEVTAPSGVRPLVGFTALHAAWIVTGWAIDRADPPLFAIAIGATIAASAALLRFALAGAVLVLFLAAMVLMAPDVPNHAFFVALILTVGVLFEPTAERGLVAVASLAIGWAGVQKLLAGTWTEGQTLAFLVAHEARFHAGLGWLTEPGEIERWRSTGQFIASGKLAALGLVVMLGEIAIAIGLALAPTRRAAVVLGLAMTAGFALVARELTFAMALAALLTTLGFPRAFTRGWRHAAAVLWAVLLLGRLVPFAGGLH